MERYWSRLSGGSCLGRMGMKEISSARRYSALMQSQKNGGIHCEQVIRQKIKNEYFFPGDACECLCGGLVSDVEPGGKPYQL